MDKEALAEALNAVHDEAMKLLNYEMSGEVRKGLELIISISRHQTDIRSSEEKSS